MTPFNESQRYFRKSIPVLCRWLPQNLCSNELDLKILNDMMTSMCDEQEKGVHCKIKDVIFKNNKLHPVIVSFQNGKLIPESTGDLQCGIYNCKTTHKKIVVVATDEVTYQGTLEEDEKNMCRLLLAVRNKRTNKVRLIEVDQVELKPNLVKKIITEDKTIDDDVYTTLYKTFGSKKFKRKLEQRSMQKLEMTAMENQISEALDASTSILDDSATNLSFDTTNGLVPCNRTATDVSEVYKLEDFISDSELNSFKDIAIKLQEDPSAVESYSIFFQKCLINAPAANKIHCTKILLYAECLISFLKLGYKDLKKKKLVICPESQSLNQRILKTFTVPSDAGRSRPINLRDKTICYIIVLGLLANNYKLNIDYISQSIKIGLSKLQQLSRVVGTVPVASANKSVQVLKIPLPPLINSNRKRKSFGRGNR